MDFSSQFPVHELKQNVFLVTILQAMTYLKSACCESNASVSKYVVKKLIICTVVELVKWNILLQFVFSRKLNNKG